MGSAYNGILQYAPWSGSIGCIPLGQEHPSQRPPQTLGGYSHCTRRAISNPLTHNALRLGQPRTHKKPWPMFTMGWTGEAAAASLTIDLSTSHQHITIATASAVEALPDILALTGNSLGRPKRVRTGGARRHGPNAGN